MKKKILIAAMVLITAAVSYAQDFKLAKSSGRLEIYLSRVTVEGHNGNEIIFTSKGSKHQDDERAQGLRALNSMGLEDNTGLGIHVADKGNVVEVHQLKKIESPDVKILVPKGMIVSYKFESQYHGDVKFKNVENEIEVSAQYNSITLDNVTGPLTVKTIYGSVDAVFGSVIKDPVSIISVYGHVDVTMPATTKADLKMSTSYGEILVAPEFKIDVEKSSGGMMSFGDGITGKINGGGLDIDLSANYGKIYLRTKK